MTAKASVRAIRSFMSKNKPKEKLNILTFPTHERYEENLCRTGHNFYAFNYGKTWNSTYAPIPENYHVINSLPAWLDIDLILSHTSCERLQVAHDLLSETLGTSDKIAIPILRHCHITLDIRNSPDYTTLQDFSVLQKNYKNINVFRNSFISKYNMNAWGYTEDEAFVVNHGIDTEFWKPDGSIKRDNVLLSVVNDWPNRDWCCGFNLWKNTVKLGTENQLPVRVFGDSPGLSTAAKDKWHLRQAYQSSSVFYNTSLFSPVPTVLMEAMACGCAVVSTNNCMIPEVIEHGYNGLLSNDPEELTSYCELLLKKPEFARRLGNNARLTILEKYNMENFINNWNTLLYNTVGDFRC